MILSKNTKAFDRKLKPLKQRKAKNKSGSISVGKKRKSNISQIKQLLKHIGGKRVEKRKSIWEK